MGDPVLDKLFNGFGYIFGPILIGSILFGISVVSWVAATIVHNMIDGFKLANQKVIPPVTDDAARQEVLKLRAIQDEARLRRVTRRAAIQRDIANHVTPEDNDLMAELVGMQEPEPAAPQPTYYLARNPLGAKPEYFYGLLPGRSTERGARDVRFLFTIKSRAKKLTEDEAKHWLEVLPNRREVFMVSTESFNG